MTPHPLEAAFGTTSEASSSVGHYSTADESHAESRVPITAGLPVTRSQFARLAFEAFLTMLRSGKICRMELKVLFSEDPAFVGPCRITV